MMMRSFSENTGAKIRKSTVWDSVKESEREIESSLMSGYKVFRNKYEVNCL